MTRVAFATERKGLPKKSARLVRMAPKNNEHFARVVRETMAQLGLTQAKVAERGGPSDTTLRKILDGEPVGLSTLTLTKLDSAFGWDAGSAAAVLGGQLPTVSGVLRDRDGRRLYAYVAEQGYEQPHLERLRLAVLLRDLRDYVRAQRDVRLSFALNQLDEAFELAMRSMARERNDELSNDELEWAQKQVEAERATRSVRRQGAIYVVDDEPLASSDDHRPLLRAVEVIAAEIRNGEVYLRDVELPSTVTSESEALAALREMGESQGFAVGAGDTGDIGFDMVWVGDGVEIVIEVKRGPFLVEAMEQLLKHARAYVGRQSDHALAARTGVGKTREQIEYERHAAAGEESQEVGERNGD